MKMMKSLIAGTALVFSLPASAATFILTYSGAPFGNTARATGTFTIADSVLAAINARQNMSTNASAITDLSLTITGAGGGNGTFTKSDFSQFAFNSPSAIDFSKELIGQRLTNGLTFGDRTHSGSTGDFNLFGTGGTRPVGTNYFELATSNRTGVHMALMSITAAAVPEPATWGMMILGFGVIGAVIRRRKVRTTVEFA